MSGLRAWVRAYRWALIAVVVLAAASTWYALAFDWTRYQNGNPTQVLDVPSGKQATYGGGTFSIKKIVVLAGDSPEGERYGVTPGTDVVVADVRITPAEDGDPDGFLPCELMFQSPSEDGVREWRPESGNPTTYPSGNPDVFSCNVSGGPAYTYRQFFVVPAGGAVDGTVLVTIQEELPLALRLH